jgi:hypothetical protein
VTGESFQLRFDYRPNASLPALLRAFRRKRLFSGLTSAYAALYQLNSFVLYKNLGGSPILTSAGTEPIY